MPWTHKMHVERTSTLKAHSAPLYALAPGRKLGTLFSGGGDRVIAEWDLGNELTNPFGIRTDATIYSLLNIDQQTLLIGTNKGSIHVIDLASKKEIRHLKLHDQGIFHMRYCSKLKRVYVGCADESISVWEAEQWSLLWHLKLGQGKVRRIALDADQSHVAIACGNGSIQILETADNKTIYSIEAHDDGANSLAFLPNGNLVTGGKDAHLRVWNAKDHFRQLIKIPAHNFAIYDIIVHPQGNWLATASRDKTVKIWDIDLLEKPLRLDRKSHQGHTHSVNALCYLEEEDLLASCSDDRTICLWKVGI